MTPEPSDADRALSVRDRLLVAADRLFYGQGIQATSADRIIAEVGTTKATFYRHFPTKDHLVVAYLEAKSAEERSEMTEAASAPDPSDAVRGVVRALAAGSCEPGFRGCPFINAAAEFPDPAHPVRRIVGEQRHWWVDFFTALAIRTGVADRRAPEAAVQLMMLRDGALVTEYADEGREVTAPLTAAFAAVLTAAGAR